MQTLTLAPPRSFLIHATSSLPRPHSLLLLLFRSPFSSSSSSSPGARRGDSSFRQHDAAGEDSKEIKVSVWWDYENCAIPAGVNVYRVANRIISALRSSGIRGPVSINAFGDMWRIPRSSQEALISTGICLTHAPNGKNSADRLLMADLITWTAHNPPPAHFFLISSDSDFATMLHRLRMNNYNVLLSCVDLRSNASLYSAATLMWPWVPLVKGEDFAPKQFNHPPDGMYGSWYGDQKEGLDDPFEEDPLERAVRTRPPPVVVPKSFADGVRHILNSRPNGVPLSVLHRELKARNLLLLNNDGFFGFKKFSDFVYSRPDILTVVPPPAGKNELYAVLARKRPAKVGNGRVEVPSVEDPEEPAIPAQPTDPAEPEQVIISKQPNEPEKQSEESSETVRMNESQPPIKPVESINPIHEIDNKKENLIDDLEKGIFGRFRKVLFGSHQNSKEAEILNSEKDNLTENNMTDEPKEKHVVHDDGSLFRKIGRWFGFRREKGGCELFADETFWSDVECFLTSVDGADLVAKSKTRKDLMHGLAKARTLSLHSLEDSHLLQLVNLLISEKKWIQENVSNTSSPFTLSIPSASILSDTNPNISPESMPDPVQPSIKKPSYSKRKRISDCRKLVKEMLNEHPEGFDMGIFKPRFEGEFGYMLEYKKLGFPKLVSLLQTFPGIKIDLVSNRVYKHDNNKEANNESDDDDIDDDIEDVVEMENNNNNNNNEEDSVFDELGPVSKEINVGYLEPSLSDEEFSDESESETEASTNLDKETRKEQSSLIRILDTFASSKERDANAMRKEISRIDGVSDCSRRHENNNKSELWLGGENNVRNVRPLRLQKRGLYKFVAEEDEDDDKEKIVDSILGTLKKNGDSHVVAQGKGI